MRRVLAKHPDAHCVLDHFPGMEGYRVWINGPFEIRGGKDMRVLKWWRSGQAFKSPSAAWADAAKRFEC